MFLLRRLLCTQLMEYSQGVGQRDARVEAWTEAALADLCGEGGRVWEAEGIRNQTVYAHGHGKICGNRGLANVGPTGCEGRVKAGGCAE